MEEHPVKFKYSNKAAKVAKKTLILDLTEENSRISLNYSSSKIIKECHNQLKFQIERVILFCQWTSSRHHSAL